MAGWRLTDHISASLHGNAGFQVYPEFETVAREQFSKRLASGELVERLIFALRKAGLNIPDGAVETY